MIWQKYQLLLPLAVFDQHPIVNNVTRKSLFKKAYDKKVVAYVPSEI